jgi:nucleotide-binding universal stress UspA family protein
MTQKTGTQKTGTQKTGTQKTGPGRVVAATDGTPAGIRGVRFAAHEAKRLAVSLEIVHVIPAYLPIGPFPMIPDDPDNSVKRYGREALEQAGDAAHEIAPGLEVSTTLITGGRVDSIVHLARDAGLVVLGSHPLTISERLWSGATVPGVAARASCPVITVPADHDPHQPVGRIVVCVKTPDRSAGLLESAFAVAKQFGSELTILHAWKLPPGYDDILSTQAARDQWRYEQQTVIDKVISDANLRGRYPQVPLQVQIIHGTAALVLTTESRDADRLLITRPVHGGYFHHLGSTARAVLREAHCPVEVFPPVRERPAETPAEKTADRDLELERDGVLQG